jgi:serine/threonine protein kinase
MERAPDENPAHLPAGTLLGPWCVEAWRGQGAYGAVYRAHRVGQKEAEPAALKLALYPGDARFAREAELLSRLSHPSIPRLLDRGQLRHASGTEQPFFVMEWVEGTALYTWAQQHAPSYPQQCQLLAQLARALAAIHAANAVHRDVKGDNVLVRHSDGRALLIDFGSAHFQGAARLTWQSLPPVTPGYLSAQACLFHIRLARERDSYYLPTPADDLYALGVTAYRLVMGEYPPPMDVREDEHGSWQVTSPDPRPSLERNPRVQPLLREWILRLLSDAPEVRGTARQLAEDLEAEAAAKMLDPAQASTGAAVPSNWHSPREWMRGWRPWLALAAACVSALLLWDVKTLPFQSASRGPRTQVPEAGPAAVGDTSSTEPLASTPSSPGREPVTQEPLPQPRPGQTKPDEKGRCPGRTQVPINGGCWVDVTPAMTAEACVENGYVLFKGRCYTHAVETSRKPPPTSNPSKAR